MTKALGILGPLLAAFGALILIIDMLRSPVRWWELVYHPIQRYKIETDSNEVMLQRAKELSNYPEAERQKIIDDQKELYEKRIYEDQVSVAKKDLEERRRMAKFAIVGFLFILVGSLMQSGAAAWPAPPQPPPPPCCFPAAK